MVGGLGDATSIYLNINNIKAKHLVKYVGFGECFKEVI